MIFFEGNKDKQRKMLHNVTYSQGFSTLLACFYLLLHRCQNILFLYHQNVVVYFRDNSFGNVQELILYRVGINSWGSPILNGEGYYIRSNEECGVEKND